MHPVGNSNWWIMYTTKPEVAQTEKKCRASIQACEIAPMLWFFKHTYLHVLRVICRICASYFAASLALLHTIGRHGMWWCERMKKLMPRRFSTSTELIMNFDIISGTWKSARHRFSCARTPTGDMAPYCILKYPTDYEIWVLNSHYFTFCMQNRVCTECTPKWDVFCANTVLDDKHEILVVQRPCCYGNRV